MDNGQPTDRRKSNVIKKSPDELRSRAIELRSASQKLEDTAREFDRLAAEIEITDRRSPMVNGKLKL